MTDRDVSQGEAAYAQLLTAIRRGDFLPGDRLRETDVADRLSLSRTPVREALRRLEADGIVEHRPRVGAVIRQLSHTELVELYEMRTTLAMCAWCRSVRTERDGEERWQPVHEYIGERIEISHGICPTCMESKLGHQ